MPTNLLRQPNFAALLALVWLVVALALLLQYWPHTVVDPHQRLLGEASRLIDAGRTGLLAALGFVTDPVSAERLTRAWWPLLWLLPTMAAMAAIAGRIAGREAATAALLLAIVGIPAYQQFLPGRVDPHSAMIALTMLAVAATVWSDRKNWASFAAGICSAFALAVGFECLPYLIVCAAVFALRYVADRDAARELTLYGIGLAVALLIAFGVSVDPVNWMRSACNVIAINNVVAMASGGLVLALAGWLAHPHRLTRIVAVLGSVSLAVAALLLLEPRCASSIAAARDPMTWLGGAAEAQSLLAAWRKNPLVTSALLAFPAGAVIAVLVLIGQREVRRDAAFLTTVLAFTVAAAAAVFNVRALPYATWLGMPLIAIVSLRLFGALKPRSAVA